jgi:hypothetical protein
VWIVRRRDTGKHKNIMAAVLSKLQGKIVHSQAREIVDSHNCKNKSLCVIPHR